MDKYKPDGYTLQVGDRIEVVGYGSRIDIVYRVTKTMAICKSGGPVDIRYPRVYSRDSFHILPYSRTTLRYNVLEE